MMTRVSRIVIVDKHWRIVAGNGEITAHSEQYATRWGARRAARRLSKATGFPLAGES